MGCQSYEVAGDIRIAPLITSVKLRTFRCKTLPIALHRNSAPVCPISTYC